MYFLSIHFLPSRPLGEMKTKNEIKTLGQPWNLCSLLFGQDGWILISVFLYVFMDLDFVSVDENATKELSQYLVILTSHSVNIVYEYISCRPIKIWQGKTVQEIVVLPSPEFVQRIGQWTSFPCNLVHKVLTSALITQIYRQNLLH